MSNPISQNDNSAIIPLLSTAFAREFGGQPSLIVRAPGRVNLIGEHTDYNDGFVMPLAIDRAAWVAARPRSGRQVALWSENFQDRQAFSLDRIEPAGGVGAWSNYTRGVAWVFERAGFTLRGMEAVVWGDVPIGSGLSSSAALEVAGALAFSVASALAPAPTRVELAQLAQRAEVEFVGVNCGIMDQLICVCGESGNALLIDCRSLASEPAPIPPNCALVVADTMKRRGLVDSKYNERRGECEEGARRLGIRSLRDITPAEFERRQDDLPDVIRRRCRHVLSENERVLACAHALRHGQVELVGKLLGQSHASLRDDYEVSSRELDLMVELACSLDGLYGARMTGAGFGGCTINLVRRDAAGAFGRQLAAAYRAQTGIDASVFRVEASQGARLVSLPR